MRIFIRPFRDAAHPIDVTDALVEAVARELGRRCGGNAVLNRLEAAAQIEQVLVEGTRVRSDAQDHDVLEGSARELESEEVIDDVDTRRIASRPDRRLRQPQGLALQRAPRVAGPDAPR